MVRTRWRRVNDSRARALGQLAPAYQAARPLTDTTHISQTGRISQKDHLKVKLVIKPSIEKTGRSALLRRRCASDVSNRDERNQFKRNLSVVKYKKVNMFWIVDTKIPKKNLHLFTYKIKRIWFDNIPSRDS